MRTWQADIRTDDGVMPTYLAHPDDAETRPLVILYMDALGIRAELETMARRTAAAGYYVMLPNLFYRDGGPSFDASRLPEYIDAEMERLNVETTMTMVASDTGALLAHAENDPLALATRIGVIGYCMGGRHAITAAAEFPNKVRAAASIHGGRLVSTAGDSAHLRLRQIEAEVYFAFADRDSAAPLEHLERIRAEMRLYGITGVAELHLGALHGFAFEERYCYDQGAAQRCREHWFAMLKRSVDQRAINANTGDSSR